MSTGEAVRRTKSVARRDRNRRALRIAVHVRVFPRGEDVFRRALARSKRPATASPRGSCNQWATRVSRLRSATSTNPKTFADGADGIEPAFAANARTAPRTGKRAHLLWTSLITAMRPLTPKCPESKPTCGDFAVPHRCDLRGSASLASSSTATQIRPPRFWTRNRSFDTLQGVRTAATPLSPWELVSCRSVWAASSQLERCSACSGAKASAPRPVRSHSPRARSARATRGATPRRECRYDKRATLALCRLGSAFGSS
jgi:hypothetical protein